MQQACCAVVLMKTFQRALALSQSDSLYNMFSVHLVVKQCSDTTNLLTGLEATAISVKSVSLVDFVNRLNKMRFICHGYKPRIHPDQHVLNNSSSM